MGSAELLSPALAAAIVRELGGSIEACSSVGGGDSHAAVRVRVAGRDAFVKLGRPGDAATFAAEADGLAWLREADALRIPEVLACGDAATPYLALEWVTTGTGGDAYELRLGHGLAALHRHGAPSFGHIRDNVCGRIPQRNAARADWPSFYGEQRLLPLVQRTRDEGTLDRDTARAIERVVARLAELCGPAEPPARLHGDLWAGNAICDGDGHPVLVDPAVYGGHREIDLAMMRLFGGFSARSFAAYHERFPLAPGAAERVALYQLYPLLVHVAMFGSSWVARLRRAAASYG
jgi:fructosamine-3-kinase